MKTLYTNMNDAELVRAVLDRYELTQVALATKMFIAESSISKVLHDKISLRPAIRKQLIKMLEEKDNAED